MEAAARTQRLREVIGALPAALHVWHAGRTALPSMLQLLAMRRIELTAREGTHPALVAPEHLRLETSSSDLLRHSTASIVEWSTVHLRDEASLVPRHSVKNRHRRRGKGKRPARVARRVDQRDLAAACDLAYDWRTLEVVDIGLASGDLAISDWQGNHIWIQNHRRAEVEVLDLVLSGVTMLEPAVSLQADSRTRAWFEGNHNRPERLHSLPESIRRTAWEEAHALLVEQGTTIPVDTDLGKLTLREARRCYALLIAQLYLNELCTVHLGTEQTLVWGIKPINLVTLLTPYANARSAAAFVDFCRYLPGRSPLSAPLVPHGSLLLIPSPLVSPIAYERSLLRAATADPSRVGNLGRILGARARRWADRLGSIPGCQVAERVKVKDRTKRTLGDLDIAVWDPEAELIAVFETKWPVDAATLAESYKVDAHFASGRKQVQRLRDAITRDEAVIEWPHGWAVPQDARIRWWIASAQQLDSSPDAGSDGIGSTSLRLVEQLLPQPDLATFVEALQNVPMPRQGIEFDLVAQVVSVGPYRLHVDAIRVNDAPLPPPERRVSRGWT